MSAFRAALIVVEFWQIILNGSKMADEKESQNFRHLVRIKNTDLDGRKHASIGLTKIKGIGYMFSNMVLNLAKVERTKKLGVMSPDEIKKIEDVISNLDKHNVPVWMKNRRKDYETGEDKHLMTSDLDFTRSNDQRRMQRSKSYRGLRLSWGLPVRGQRTKSNFRRSKGKGLGVKRKK